MQTIQENIQNPIIEKPYTLVRMPLDEVRGKLLKTYRRRLPETDVRFFSFSSLLYGQFDNFLHTFIPHRLSGEVVADNITYKACLNQLVYKTEPITEDLRSIIDIYEESKHFGDTDGNTDEPNPKRRTWEKPTVNYKSALEQGFIEVEVDEQGEWSLLDGFRRLFINTELGDMEVFVKVYEKLDDVTWLNYMVNTNFWKTTYSTSFMALLNRGFMFSLFCREGISAIDTPKEYFQTINSLMGTARNFRNHMGRSHVDIENINAYAHNNDVFFQDVQLPYKLLTFLEESEFKLVSGRGGTNVKEVFRITNKWSHLKTSNLMLWLMRIVIGSVGEARAYEYRNNLPRKALDVERVKEFFADLEVQKMLHKAYNIQVTGTAENNVEKNILPPLRKAVHDALGYTIK